MKTLEQRFEELKANIHNYQIKAVGDNAGKNQRKFIDLVNIGLLDNELAFKQAMSHDDLTLENCLTVAINNPKSTIYENTECTDDEIMEAMIPELLRTAWYKLAHTLDTQRTRSLPALDFIFYNKI